MRPTKPGWYWARYPNEEWQPCRVSLMSSGFCSQVYVHMADNEELQDVSAVEFHPWPEKSECPTSIRGRAFGDE